VVVSTAVKADNPEVLAARARRIPVVPRAVMLAELMRLKQGIAIAGTHGKTTTTSLVASVLAEAGVDPTFVIGGKLNSAGANSPWARATSSWSRPTRAMPSFLHLLPVLSVVTNIDADHMDTYGHDLPRLHGAFVDFLHRMPFYGAAIVCGDDAGVRAILPHAAAPGGRYGLGRRRRGARRDVQALPGGRMRFVVRAPRRPPTLPVDLNLAGEHNVRNALAAIAVAGRTGAARRAVAQGRWRSFAGVGRRFQRYGDCRARRRQLHADRRLRPPPGGDGRGAGRRARRLPGPAPGAGLPAAPLHPHARLLRGLRGRDGRPTPCC
jgi:UDP-N-acetylmuramate--alanine ligase